MLVAGRVVPPGVNLGPMPPGGSYRDFVVACNELILICVGRVSPKTGVLFFTNLISACIYARGINLCSACKGFS